jgi:hypothetical protein
MSLRKVKVCTAFFTKRAGEYRKVECRLKRLRVLAGARTSIHVFVQAVNIGKAENRSMDTAGIPYYILRKLWCIHPSEVFS